MMTLPNENIPVQTILPELDEEGKIILKPEAVTEKKKSIDTKSINFRISYQVEEVTH